MERNGTPIAKRGVRNSLDAGIRYSAAFECWEAAVSAHLDLERLYNGEYTPDFLSYVLAWHRGHQLIAIHQSDAQVEHARRGRRK